MTIICGTDFVKDIAANRFEIYYGKKYSLFKRRIVLYSSWDMHEDEFLSKIEDFVNDNFEEKVVELVKRDVTRNLECLSKEETNVRRIKQLKKNIYNTKFEFELEK